MKDTASDDREAEFGPGGYLPERAARRARKIVLRAPMGMQWIVASVIAGVAVLGAGVLFLTRSDQGPAAPWVAVADVNTLDEATVLEELDILIVSAGRIRAFPHATELGLAWCTTNRRIEATDGSVWLPTGRGLGGVASLLEHPTLVHRDVLYVDPTRTSPGPPPSSEPAERVC